MPRESAQQFVQTLAVLLLVVVIGFYSFSRMQDFLFGPEISIVSPLPGEVVDDDLITVSGTVQKASHIYLNGRKIYTNEQGGFSEKLLLHYGYNTIELRALDRFDQEKKEVIQLVYR